MPNAEQVQNQRLTALESRASTLESRATALEARATKDEADIAKLMAGLVAVTTGTVVSDTGNPTTNGTNLQTAINAATPGDTIVVTAGAEYRGNFTLPNKSGANYITIQTSSVSALASGVRVSPSSSTSMAKLTTATTNPVLSFLADSHHWRFIGIELTTTSAVYAGGSTAASLIQGADNITYNHWPNHLDFDRCLLHPLETGIVAPFRSVEHAFLLDGSDITIQNSYVYDFMGWYVPVADGVTVTAASNANPVQVTFSTGVSYASNDKILMTFSGATGNWTPINGTKVVTKVDATHGTLQDYDPTTLALTNINSTGFGALTGSVIRMQQAIMTSIAITIIGGPGPYTIRNNFLEAYYAPLFTGGGTGTWIDPAHQTTVTNVGSLTQVTLASVTDLQVNDLIAFSAVQDQAISGATAGNPTQITVPTHQYPAGKTLVPEGYITISGFTGNWAPLNGKWGGNGNSAGSGNVTVVDSTHLSISAVDSSGFGAVTSSSPKYVLTTKDASVGNTQWVVGKVTNIAGSVVTVAYQGNTKGGAGNGNGILIANGANVEYRGRTVDGLTIQKNTISNKLLWIKLLRDVANTVDNGSGQPPKGSWESKMATNVLFDGNIVQIEGGAHPTFSGQVAVGPNQANQVGRTPWTSNSHWVISNNLFKGYTYLLVSMAEEYESGTTGTDFVITNNLFTKSNAMFLAFHGGDAISATHNTIRNFGTLGGSGGGYNSFWHNLTGPATNGLIRDNVGRICTYGYQDSIGDNYAGFTRDHNFLTDDQTSGVTLPGGDTKVATDVAMKFVDLTTAEAGGDYHGYALAADSPGHNASSTGNDVGVNFTALDAALA